MGGHGAHAHKHGALAVHLQRLTDGLCHLVQVASISVVRQLMDQCHIRLAHAENKVVLPVREQALDHIHRHGFQPLINRPDDKYTPAHLHRHMQLLGAHVNIADEDIVRNNILNKRALVVLFLIVGLGRVQGHAGHGAHSAAHAVVPTGKHGVVKVTTPAGQRLEGLALDGHTVAISQLDSLHILSPLLANPGELAAGDDAAFGIHNANDPIRGLLKLQHYILKDPSRHDIPPGHP